MDYKDESIWLMQGDCLERMKEIEDCSVDAVLTDIPYGIDYSDWDIKHSNSNSALMGCSPAQEKSKLFKSRGKPKNGWSEADKQRPIEFQLFCETWLKELFRVTKPCSPIIMFTGRQYQHRATIAAENSGFIFKDSLVWDKQNAPFRAQHVNKVLASKGIEFKEDYRLGNLAPVAEPILWLFKPYKIGSTITENFLLNGLGCVETSQVKSNIISISSRIKDRKHETEKPIELTETLVKMFSKEGHFILDLFMGSGTTGVACTNTNRKFIGIEMYEDYFNIAKERILNANK